MDGLDTDAVSLAGVELLQLVWEIETAGVLDLFPPAVHPTVPPIAIWLVMSARSSPWGPFQLAQTLLECRSSTRPRRLLVSGVIDNAEARHALTTRWGYTLAEGSVDLESGYQETRARVSVDGALILEAGLRDPVALGTDDIQFIASMHLAHTPRGLRLVQVDPEHDVARAERGVPFLDRFDPLAWGDDRIKPVHPVSGAYAITEVTLPRLRYLCRPDELAFSGTERL